MDQTVNAIHKRKLEAAQMWPLLRLTRLDKVINIKGKPGKVKW